MPIVPTVRNTFAQGELGPYLDARVDLEVYARGAKRIQNLWTLPQGGVKRKSGFKAVAKLDIALADADDSLLWKFDRGNEQQYVLVFSEENIAIFKDDAKVADVPTPYAGTDLRNLRFAQSGDALVMVNEGYPSKLLERLTADNLWQIGDIDFVNIPFYRFNVQETLTPSGTTGSITLTVSGTNPYWRSGHIGVDIKLNGGVAAVTGFAQSATGGTALSSAGTAANAFDGNPANTCNSGSDGWIGYAFSGATQVSIVGINSNATGTLTLVCEADDNNSFTSPTAIQTLEVDVTSGTTEWFDVLNYTGQTHFRVRAVGGTLDVKDVYFSKGLVANATTSDNLDNTNASEEWLEWAWSDAQGYPRSVTFYQNRLIFGGTEQAPSTIFGSKTGDFFNFDDTATNDDNAIEFTLTTDSVEVIRDIKGQKNLNIFTGAGEHEMRADNGPITPTSIQVDPQSAYGIYNIPVIEVDGQLFFFTGNGKELRSFVFNLASDRYNADNKTVLAHHMFVRDKFPKSMAYLRSYKDFQGNFLFVTREDGQMAVLTIDVVKNVLSWSRWITQGEFKSVAVVQADFGYGKTDTLFAIVKRDTGVFLEALTEEEIYMDHYYTGSSVTPKTQWDGIDTLIGMTIQVVGDGLVKNETQVYGTISAAAPSAAGSGYTLGDVLTLVGGTGDAGTLVVASVDGGGAILSVTVGDEGAYSELPSDPVAVTGGTGSGATFNITWNGRFDIDIAASEIQAGLRYDSLLETTELIPVMNGTPIRGEPMAKKKAIITLQNTQSLKVDGFTIPFRHYDSQILDSPLPTFNGTLEIRIKGISRNPTVILSVEEPLPCTILALTTELKVGL